MKALLTLTTPIHDESTELLEKLKLALDVIGNLNNELDALIANEVLNCPSHSNSRVKHWETALNVESALNEAQSLIGDFIDDVAAVEQDKAQDERWEGQDRAIELYESDQDAYSIARGY